MTAFQKSPDNSSQNRIPLAYPFNWQSVDDFRYPVDAQGIPRVYIDRKWGYRYNPITTAQLGLHQLTRYARDGSKEALVIARNMVCWLRDTAQNWQHSSKAWIYDYDLSFYGPKAPWISAMAQGEAISLLLRWQQIEPDEKLAELCQAAVRVFFHPVAAGGVASAFPDGSPIFEEYPTDPPSQVLNGHMFALLGLHDFVQYFEDTAAARLFNAAIAGLERNLRLYDTGYWNYYDLHPTRRLASPMYIRVHVRLLQALYDITQSRHFLQVAQKWQRYLDDPIRRLRWLAVKSHEKIRLGFWRR